MRSEPFEQRLDDIDGSFTGHGDEGDYNEGLWATPEGSGEGLVPEHQPLICHVPWNGFEGHFASNPCVWSAPAAHESHSRYVGGDIRHQ